MINGLMMGDGNWLLAPYHRILLSLFDILDYNLLCYAKVLLNEEDG